MIRSAAEWLALAPDAASAKAGEGLARPAKWSGLARSERAAWGECAGSGAQPYRVRVDLAGPAFKCSCPSRKFPCKHGIALSLLLARSPDSLALASPPDWVAEWLDQRDRAAKPAAPTEPDAPPDPARVAAREADQTKRAAKREARVLAAADELGRWLADLLRAGLAGAQATLPAQADALARRMVDGQAPGLARWARQLGDLARAGGEWTEPALELIGRIFLLTEGLRRLDKLPDPVRHDVRAAAGWTLGEEELRAVGETVTDRWIALGRRVEQEPPLRVRRTWALGERSGRWALLLAFAAGNAPLDPGPPVGSAWEGALVFHPSSTPLRAAQGAPSGPLTALTAAPPLATTLREALAQAGARIAAQPWLERAPLGAIAVALSTDRKRAADDSGALPLLPTFRDRWRWLALTGGQPAPVFGEWDGRMWRPLGVFAAGQWHAVGTEEAIA